MPEYALNDCILWPNLEGLTPCTPAYAAKMAERDAIKAKPEYEEVAVNGFVPMDYLSPDDYQAWNQLDAELGSMQIEGQVGMGEKF